MYQKWMDVIHNSELFANIAEVELLPMLNCIRPELKRYAKNETVAMAGDVFLGIGIVLAGNVTVIKENVAGNRVILSMLGPDEMFGEMAAFSGKKIWPASVVAQSEATVFFLSPEKIVGNCPQQCLSHRQLIMNLLKIISNKALLLNKKLEYLSIRNLREKIATFLLEQFTVSGQTTFMLPMNRNELADFLNITRPSLSREMGHLREEGIIDFHRATIRIHNLDALRKMIGAE